MRALVLIVLAVVLAGCGSPQRRLASEVRAAQTKVAKAEERVRVVERTIVDREALPLAKLTLGLLEIARERIPAPPVSLTMATGAATRTLDRLTRAAGPLDADDERRVQAGLQAARAADADSVPALPSAPATPGSVPITPPARPPAPDIFAHWDAAAVASDAEAKAARSERDAARAVAAVSMAKAADALDEAAAYRERKERWFGLGQIFDGFGALLRLGLIGGAIALIGTLILSFFFPPAAALLRRFIPNPFRSA